MINQRLNKLRQELPRHKIDALLITKRVNVNYLSAFTGQGQLIIAPAKKVLLVDFRYQEQAAKEAKGFSIHERQGFLPWEESILRLAAKLKLNSLGFEALTLPYQSYLKLKKTVKPARLVPTTEIVERLRAIKSVQEIQLIKKAAALAVKSFAFARKIIQPGKKEEQIARELQYYMRQLGAQDSAFEIIVASGKRSSLPHASSSPKVIKNNEAVLIDLGCRISGYNSDLTRVVFLGKINNKIKQIYQIVLQAQQLAINAIRPGVEIAQIDKIARSQIAKFGFGACFGHSLGHGIGREVHEYPDISPQNQEDLREGMVFTIEPGVYLPGWGGIRVEDMVLVSKSGHELLTKVD